MILLGYSEVFLMYGSMMAMGHVGLQLFSFQLLTFQTLSNDPVHKPAIHTSNVEVSIKGLLAYIKLLIYINLIGSGNITRVSIKN